MKVIIDHDLRAIKIGNSVYLGQHAPQQIFRCKYCCLVDRCTKSDQAFCSELKCSYFSQGPVVEISPEDLAQLLNIPVNNIILQTS